MTFKYRPEVKSIEDLQPGDEFLVGDDRWAYDRGDWCMLCEDFIRANVPIERDIPYPEGGAEEWELREGDGEPMSEGSLVWSGHEWIRAGFTMNGAHYYAIPKAKPQDKPAPKEYEVYDGGALFIQADYDSYGNPLEMGDRVTVQRVSEQGEPR
jgi:hypothetical protein